MAAGIDQLPDRGLSEIYAFSKLPNLSHYMVRLFSLASVGWNQFRNWTPPRNLVRLPLGNSFQQAIEMGFGIKDSDGSLVSHVSQFN
jgi:hypothetical protein